MNFASLKRLWQALKSDPMTAEKLRLLKPLVWKTLVWLLVNELIVLMEVYPIKLLVDRATILSGQWQHGHLYIPTGVWWNLAAIIAVPAVIFAADSLTWRYMDQERNSTAWLFYIILNAHGTRKQFALDAGWHSANGTSAKESMFAKNLKKVDFLVDEVIFNMAPQTLRIWMIGLSMFWIDWRFGLLATVSIIIYMMTMLRTERQLKAPREDYRSYTRRIERSDTELAATALTSKEQGIERRLAADHDNLLMEHWRKEVPRHLNYLKLTWRQSQVIVVSRVAFFALAGFAFVTHSMDIGVIVMASAWMERVWSNLWRYSNFQYIANEGGQALKEIVALFELEPVICQPEKPVWPARFMGHLALENVSFTYPGCTRPALSGINLEFEPGTTVAFVGPSGGGKSTLAKLIGHSYNPDAGRILVDGVDLTEIDGYRYREELLAIVPQEPGLYDRGVADNIGIARPGATRDEIVEAARLADAHDFIMRLPGGYDAQIGERGVMLSGGQRQRLAIARALLKGARILVLDEPTSALDAESQLSIKETLEKLTANRDRTIMIIAHRFSTIAMADVVVVMEDGRVTEFGTHDELVAGGQTYARLHELEGVSS
jgi:ABC-type multidrug transport system fused ATPase/permease subunit